MEHFTFESFPPIHGTYPAVLGWLKDEDATRWQDALRYSATFSEQSIDPGEQELRDLWPSGAQLSWLGGPAVDTGTWPHAADGTPLAHVATIDLAGLDGTMDRAGKAQWPRTQLREGLPQSGILQLFHDLRTFGYDAEDRTHRAWAVVVTPDPLSLDRAGNLAGDDTDYAEDHAGAAGTAGGERPDLVSPPGAVNVRPAVCQLLLPFASFMLPSAMDISGEHAAYADQLERLTGTLQLAWMTQRNIGGDYAIPSTHAYGYSSRGHHTATLDILPGVLPLPDGDEYRLVLEIESWTVLAGWFGDAGSLEVWMRQSDLDAGAFENAWCLIRTD